MLVLAPWGIESNDLLSSLRAAFFGFQVGDLTISFSAILMAALLFAIGFVPDQDGSRLLKIPSCPRPNLTPACANSILTAFGYAGFILAAAFAFSYLGLGLDKLTIVAGALSVGIGFGLQSIVNNFVSASSCFGKGRSGWGISSLLVTARACAAHQRAGHRNRNL